MKIMAIDPQKKTCSKCGVTKLLDEFHKSKTCKWGRRPECKECAAKDFQKYIKEPGKKEKRKQYVAKYNIENREKIRARFKANREKYNNARRIIYSKNRGPKTEKLREWYKEHTQSRMWSSAKRRAKKYNIIFSLKKEDIFIPSKCPVLGISLIVGVGHAQYCFPSLDRIIPSKGYTPDNVIVVSHKANTIKNNATLEEIEKVLNFYKEVSLCQKSWP